MNPGGKARPQLRHHITAGEPGGNDDDKRIDIYRVGNCRGEHERRGATARIEQRGYIVRPLKSDRAWIAQKHAAKGGPSQTTDAHGDWIESILVSSAVSPTAWCYRNQTAARVPGSHGCSRLREAWAWACAVVYAGLLLLFLVAWTTLRRLLLVRRLLVRVTIPVRVGRPSFPASQSRLPLAPACSPTTG